MMPGFMSPAFPWDVRRAAQAADERCSAGWRRSSPSPATTAPARSCSTTSAARSCAGTSTTRSTRGWRCAPTSSSRGCTTRPGRAEIFTAHATRVALAAATRTSTRTCGRSRTASYAPNDVACFTAHQMGSCRMGSDPATSVADGRGELHDVEGRLDRRRQRVPDRARASTRWSRSCRWRGGRRVGLWARHLALRRMNLTYWARTSDLLLVEQGVFAAGLTAGRRLKGPPVLHRDSAIRQIRAHRCDYHHSALPQPPERLPRMRVPHVARPRRRARR